MRSTRFNLPRRNLLKAGSALFGLSALSPTAFLAACGGGFEGAAPDGRGPRESRTMNFDLSDAPIQEPTLRLANSRHHGARLLAHTDHTRSLQRQSNPTLAGVPDHRLTHYLEDVDVPANALQLGAIYGTHPATKSPVLAAHFLHVPRASRDVVRARRLQTPLKRRQPPGVGRAMTPLEATPLPSSVAFNSSPWDVGVWLVFQHPSITNLNADLGGDIVDRINNLPDPDTPFVSQLVAKIAALIRDGGYPTTADTGSWCVLVPVVDKNNLPVVDDTGAQIYRYTINPALADVTATVVKQLLNDIVNDPLFAGSNWQPSDGTPVQTQVARAVTTAFGASAAFTVQHSLPVGTRTSGIRFKSIEATDDRSVQLTVANEFLRSVGVFVEYRDSSGKTLAVDNPGEMDTQRAKYLTMVSPDAQIMGIPLLGRLTPTTQISFTMPAAASQAVIYYGGLGIGGSDAFQGEALVGSICTLVLNLGLPAICLTAGISEGAHEGLLSSITQVLDDPVTLKTVFKGVVEALGSGLGSSIQTATNTLSIEAFLAGIAQTVLDIFLDCCPRISILIAEAVSSSALQLAIPILGVALWALSTLAEAATIAETLVEVLCCPVIDTNTVSLTMSSAVQISRDPSDFQFPATARRYEIKATYDGKATQKIGATLSTGQVDPIVATFDQVASGGSVTMEAYFYADNDVLVGYGRSDTVANLPATAANIPITITEMLVPLTAATVYQHQAKLAFSDNTRTWLSTSSPPPQTRANLGTGADNQLVALHGITVHTATGNAGYGFEAGGQGVGLCGGGTASSLSSIENVFLGDRPERRLMFSSCGAAQPIGIAYDPHGAATGSNNFFLQPGGDGFFYLRGVGLDAPDFDMNQSSTWGRFMSALDSLCVTSNGYVVGVNRTNHKMEMLRLSQSASPDNGADSSQVFSALKSGYGSGVGRLDTPVAVTAFDDRLLVLEQGNARVQAFDADGSTQAIFTGADGKKSAVFPLQPEASAVYLDIAVEGAGYVYVLSYVNNGLAPSDYHLDVYTPNGTFLTRTTGVAAGAIAVDLFRNVYTLNYEAISGSPRTEPSLSLWLPSSATQSARRRT
jgi:hypothetical protein